MKERLVIAGAIGAVALVAAALLLVFRFGLERPSPPSLQDDPEELIPGELLYRHIDGCLTRIRASGAGESREICLPIADYYGPMAWIEARTVVFQDALTLRAFDLESGDAVDPPPGALSPDKVRPSFDGVEAPNGDFANILPGARLVVISGTTKTEIADFDTDQYRVRPVLWSPDSQWILLSYEPRRSDGRTELWIVSRDGRVKGTLARDARWSPWPSWRIEEVGFTPSLEELGLTQPVQPQ